MKLVEIVNPLLYDEDDPPEEYNKKSRIHHGDIELPEHIEELDFHGFTIYGTFECSGTNIKSLYGAPKIVHGSFRFDYTAVEDLEFLPERIDTTLGFVGTNVKSLANIHKMIKYIGRFISLNDRVESHILGLLKIRGLQQALLARTPNRLELAVEIINKYLKHGRDIHKCQEELIEAGLSEYAQL